MTEQAIAETPSGSAPATAPKRYAVLPLKRGLVIYDRHKYQIVNGVYYHKEIAKEVEEWFNRNFASTELPSVCFQPPDFDDMFLL